MSVNAFKSDSFLSFVLLLSISEELLLFFVLISILLQMSNDISILQYDGWWSSVLAALPTKNYQIIFSC